MLLLALGSISLQFHNFGIKERKTEKFTWSIDFKDIIYVLKLQDLF